MSSAARSVYAFSFYLFALGFVLTVAPNLLLRIFGIPETNEVWIRVVGMLVLLLGWGMFGGVVGCIAVFAAYEYKADQGLPWGRKRRLIEAGRLCECGCGEWAHLPASRLNEWPRRCQTDDCKCQNYTARIAADLARAKALDAAELYDRMIATPIEKGECVDVEA